MGEKGTVLLFYEFTYSAYGERKKNQEHPYTASGRAKSLFTYDKNESLSEQLAVFKKAVIEETKKKIRDLALFHFEVMAGMRDTIEREVVQIYNVREGTIWSSIEDI